LLERRELAMRARLEQIISELSQMRDLLIKMQQATKLSQAPAADKPAIEEGKADSQATDGEPESIEEDQARQQRMQTLRSQQAAAQLSKSEGELRGVEREIYQINQELINNRVDSVDRRTRLEDKVRKPMQTVLEESWADMAREVQFVEKTYSSSEKSEAGVDESIPKAISESNSVIAALVAILNDMVDIQDFNEAVEMLRGIIDDQDKMMEQTKQERKKQLLDSLK
jgi:hypothetical protein